jgi:hypothetical protein
MFHSPPANAGSIFLKYLANFLSLGAIDMVLMRKILMDMSDAVTKPKPSSTELL